MTWTSLLWIVEGMLVIIPCPCSAQAKSRSVVYSILTDTKYFYVSRGGGQIYVDSALTTPQANDTFVVCILRNSSVVKEEVTQ